jgi:hypothetical protein
MRNSLLIALGVVFLLLGFNAYNEAKPTPKAPIYKEIKKVFTLLFREEIWRT